MGRIYLDTNVFFKHGFFRSKGAQAIFKACALAGYKVVLPEIVIDEVHGNYEAKLIAASKALEKAENGIQKWMPHSRSEIDIWGAVEYYTENLEAIIDELNIDTLIYPSHSPKDLVIKAYEGNKPFDENGNGYKDFLVWESIKADMLANPSEAPFVFVTDNTGDFGVKKGQSNSENVFELHADLMAQIEDIRDDLTCYTLLTSALDHLILSELDGLTVEDVDGSSDRIFEFVSNMITEHLDYRTMHGLDGVPFTDDVTITGYGEAVDLDAQFYKFADDMMVRISGSVECTLSGFMDKWEFLSEHSHDNNLSGSMINDHVFEIETEAKVQFEILAIYNPETQGFSGDTFEVMNEMSSHWYS